MSQIHIVGIHISNRIHLAAEVQNLLTRYGCGIKTRLGLHEANQNNCAQSGLIIFEVIGDDGAKLVKELKNLTGVTLKEMIF